jgi:acetyl/propionyl-CoA carboxylase alpha subunit/acetyl-CoA carboxylase carboxyltransferase component
MNAGSLAGRRVLIANRGEIAIRIARTATTLGMLPVAIYSEDDADQRHVQEATEAYALAGLGAPAYLDIEAIIDIAVRHDCTMIHPGYGFLSENAAFARACAQQSITFVGPSAAVLDVFGDKTQARNHAAACGVPVLPATPGAVTLEGAIAFFEQLDAPDGVIIKPLAGGGGRGQRHVSTVTDLVRAYEACASEAKLAFGSAALFVERYCRRARHIEVQLAGDGRDVVHYWDRDCSIQRRHQKLIELAPAAALPPRLRASLHSAAIALGRAERIDNLATVEFLVEPPSNDEPDGRFWFLEVNPRVQVEHTVTEETFNVDLVRLQLELATGRTLADMGIDQSTVGEPLGYAVQARVLLERLTEDGMVLPSDGIVTTYEPPAGPGIRVDDQGQVGYRASPRYDSLIAKVIVHDGHADEPSNVLDRARDALDGFVIKGVASNIDLLRWLLAEAPIAEGRVDTRFVDENVGRYLASNRPASQRLAPESDVTGMGDVIAPMTGIVVSVLVASGDYITAGQDLIVLEALKMEHYVRAPAAGVVARINVVPGHEVKTDQVLARIRIQGDASVTAPALVVRQDLSAVRSDLAEVLQMHAAVLDDARPEPVARRHSSGRLTARENVAQVVDEGTFLEVGPLIVAAQRARRSVEELVAKSPADGLVGGIATVNRDLFGAADCQCIVMAYDYTVFAGTQGVMNHRKTDRLLELATTRRLPVIVYAEGGGGRPGDTDRTPGTTFEPRAFDIFSHLSGKVPLVGIVAGNCFAGNAVLLGLCDVIIATPDARIGMGGPAMIEAGGLGRYDASEIGPIDVQRANGVVDIVVRDEAEAARVARQYVSYFQGDLTAWDCPDQRALRHVVPENRLRAYDIYEVIRGLVDTGSLLELRRDFGVGIVTALGRVDGRPLGIIANNCQHLGGAIDRDAADKAARFMQLCDAFGLPIVSLIDNPGFMVGPEIEETAAVRHFSRMVMIGANARTPRGAIIIRKAYGLGTLAMYGGRSRITVFNVAWPTAEFGPMNLEGAVRLAYRADLEGQPDEDSRNTLFNDLVQQQYEKGKAVNAGRVFEVDDVIDPAQSRRWITEMLTAPHIRGRRRDQSRYIDTW